ncbi:MAG: NAD-dependent epimerase/dehydratase family protein [Planctomycetota bacterium]
MILVTGGTGFVGRHLVRALAGRGREVRCLVRDAARARAILPAGVLLHEGDLVDRARLEQALDGVDRVIHLAGVIKASAPQQFYQVNAAGTQQLCAAIAAVRPRLARLIHVSSLAAAGPSPADLPRDEGVPSRPISHYGKSKLAGERFVAELGERVPVTIVRPCAVYGPEDPELLKFFQLVQRGVRPAIGFGARWVSLVHVADLVRALDELLERERAAHQTFFVAEPEPYTWSFLLDLVSRTLGRFALPIVVPETLVRATGFASEMLARLLGKTTMLNRDKARELCARAWTCRTTRIETELGFHCALRVAEGLPQTIAWYQEHGWL